MLEVMPEARAARVHHLRFDATHYDSTAALKVQADDTVVSDNEITKGGNGICVQVATFNAARRVIIERNRIHNCGPADSKYDHQIYLQSSRDAIVRRNILTGNRGGWGVHLYSDADGTLVEHNIIDGNRGGVVFAGDGEETSDRNVVRNNAITNSGPRWNIEASWSGGPARKRQQRPPQLPAHRGRRRRRAADRGRRLLLGLERGAARVALREPCRGRPALQGRHGMRPAGGRRARGLGGNRQRRPGPDRPSLAPQARSSRRAWPGSGAAWSRAAAEPACG